MVSIGAIGRIVVLAAGFLVACGSPEVEKEGGPGGDESGTLPRTRLVFAQHYKNGARLVMENYAGRELAELRSYVVKKGDVPVAWVPDDVMRTTLKGLKKRDFADYARPRPANPKALGTRSELTIYDDRGKARAFLRRHGQPVEEAKAFQECTRYFRQVWTQHRPAYQAVTGDGEFGVKRSGYRRGN